MFVFSSIENFFRLEWKTTRIRYNIRNKKKFVHRNIVNFLYLLLFTSNISLFLSRIKGSKIYFNLETTTLATPYLKLSTHSESKTLLLSPSRLLPSPHFISSISLSPHKPKYLIYPLNDSNESYILHFSKELYLYRMNSL